MDSTAKIRQLLQQKINAAKWAAKRADDYIIPLEDRYIVKMSIKEAIAILDLLPSQPPEKKDPPCNFLRWCEWRKYGNCEDCVYYLKPKKGFGL